MTGETARPTRLLHEDQVLVDTATVRRLLRGQRPDLTAETLTPVRSHGTVNAMVRVGDGLVARLPLRSTGAGDLEREIAWLPRLAGVLPVAVPEVVFVGEPDDAYPFCWALYRWFGGVPWPIDGHVDEPTDALVDDLASVVATLRALPIDGLAAATGWRGDTLARTDESLRPVIAAHDGAHWNADRVTAIWEEALTAASPRRSGIHHADLLPTNLLVHDGRLRAVLDWGCLAKGDPAVEHGPLWATLGGRLRRRYRDALGVDDDEWARGRGAAVAQAVFALPYYVGRHDGMVALARRQLTALAAG